MQSTVQLDIVPRDEIFKNINFIALTLYIYNAVHNLYFLCTFLVRSRLQVFCELGILKNCAEFAGKHLCQSSIKIETAIQNIPVNFNNFLWKIYREYLRVTAFSSFIFHLFWFESEELQGNKTAIQ